MEGVASLLLGKGEFYCFRRCKNTAVFLNVNRKMGMAKKKHIPFVEVGRLEGAKNSEVGENLPGVVLSANFKIGLSI